ncbi:hypothetical protein EXT60_18485 [Pectobacterium carotovorum subsp. carotovorum]|nr:hypothetical protein [Pectobacterium carotovorum]MCL6366220.1 hypothetical protein [Pectobacterium carotovorum subsp. carotovorum]
MSVINDDFFHLIQKNIANLHNVAMSGLVTPEYHLVQNRAVLIFSLEVVLEAHRNKYSSHYSPLVGRLTLEHLILHKYKWPLREIRALTLADSIFTLHEELAFESLPESAQLVIKNFGAHRSIKSFPEINEDEWDPELYLTIQKQQNW